MYILGCAGNNNWMTDYSLLERMVLWLQDHGIPQEALIFTFVFMTMAVLKTYLLRKLDWGDSVSTFAVPAVATATSLGAGILCFGLKASTDPAALVVFGVVSVLIEGLVWQANKGLVSLKQWGHLAAVNAVALFWLWALEVPNMWVYARPSRIFFF